MTRRLQIFSASMMLVLVMTSCSASGSRLTSSTTSATQPVPAQALFSDPTPTISTETERQGLSQTPAPAIQAGDSLQTIFPSFSLPDPNTICVQHYYHALSCLDPTGWHIYQNEYDEGTHPTSTLPRYITRCPDGRIYLVDDEIYRVEGEMLEGIGGYVDQGIIACGSGNEVWVSDYSEARRFDGSAWTSYPVDEFFKNDNNDLPGSIYSLAAAPDGTVWVTTDSAIAAFDGTNWELLALPGDYYFMDSSGSSRGLAIDSNGVVWTIAYPETCCVDGQLLKFDGGEWSAIPGPEDSAGEMQRILIDHQNRVWAATARGKIFMLSPDTNEWELRFDLAKLGSRNEWESRFKEVQLGLGYSGNRLHDMAFDGLGRLWAATNYGLGIYDGETWTIYHSYTAGLYDDDISNLDILGDGPPLPAPDLKPSGSVRGRLVSKTQAAFTDAIVSICIYPGSAGTILCADADRADPVNADGSFLISNIPAGTYTLELNMSGTRYDLSESEQENCFPYCISSFPVQEGEETNLGEIPVP